MQSGLEVAQVYVDDILVYGVNKEDHAGKLLKVLDKLEKYSFKIRFHKCNFFSPEIRYLGNIINHKGYILTIIKVLNQIQLISNKTIKNLPRQTNIRQLRSFLIAVNYYGKFLPQTCKVRTTLDNLLKKGWSTSCENNFKSLKKCYNRSFFLLNYLY